VGITVLITGLLAASLCLVIRDTQLVEIVWVVDLVYIHTEVSAKWGLDVVAMVAALPMSMDVSAHS
jgi:hypothetical protein